ncbi:hypothetical protein DPMN_025972 [Dreissena polymorpha]|uniref:Uncharacterized protein n=1 Tax=Dreissena polymorpha TaxID=45954 RepID=A0A9D4RC52_DREPO|nr:hypothetical protein DPMN_025972 [Dreissena polymorpha]
MARVDQLKKTKAAKRARAYRERRNDTQHKEKERQRKKKYRARRKESISNDKMLKQREISRIRQKRYNENKKHELEGKKRKEAVKPARAKKTNWQKISSRPATMNRSKPS